MTRHSGCTYEMCARALLWREGQLCDIEVTVEGRSFQAHRIVLAARSEYMNALFGSGMAESKSASISVAEMDADAFGLVLEWMYEGRASVEALLLPEVLTVASRL